MQDYKRGSHLFEIAFVVLDEGSRVMRLYEIWKTLFMAHLRYLYCLFDTRPGNL